MATCQELFFDVSFCFSSFLEGNGHHLNPFASSTTQAHHPLPVTAFAFRSKLPARLLLLVVLATIIFSSFRRQAMLIQTLWFFILAAAAAVKSISAFVVLNPKLHPSFCKLSSLPPEDHLEDARQMFEELFQDGRTSSQVFPDCSTSVSRHRRQIEMELLASLNESDDAVEELMHLWITERDQESAEQILQMQQQCSTGLVQEEDQLRQMMEWHPTWAEPYVRLATLLYYKGRNDESYEMALTALELKPWHIEAPQLLVLLALREQDMGRALFWARRGLPPLRGAEREEEEFKPTYRRRRQWVKRSLRQAQDQLRAAERARAAWVQSTPDEQQNIAWQ